MLTDAQTPFLGTPLAPFKVVIVRGHRRCGVPGASAVPARLQHLRGARARSLCCRGRDRGGHMDTEGLAAYC